jgi:hypothetical protein
MPRRRSSRLSFWASKRPHLGFETFVPVLRALQPGLVSQVPVPEELLLQGPPCGPLVFQTRVQLGYRAVQLERDLPARFRGMILGLSTFLGSWSYQFGQFVEVLGDARLEPSLPSARAV